MQLINFSVRHLTVGVVNTWLHTGAFFQGASILSQSLANFIASFASAYFSFFGKKKFTFNAAHRISKYCFFLFFMGGISYFIAYFFNYLNIALFFTFILHCLLILTIEISLSNFLLKERGMQC